MKKNRVYRNALKTALVYGIIGTLWIFITDRLILSLVDNGEMITFYQNIKGFIFVFFSSLLLYYLVRNRLIKISFLSGELQVQDRELQATKRELQLKYDKLKKLQEKTYRLAYYDRLTGLPNREKFQQEVEDILNRQKNVGLIFLDIENFKRVNNIFGVEMGDDVLQYIASRLQQYMTSSQLVGRLDGDLFAVCNPSLESEQELKDYMEQLNSFLEGPVECFEHTFYANFNVSGALSPEHGEKASELMSCAENALYRAKKRENSQLIFKPDMKKKYARHLDLERKINQALKNDEFVLYYQPIVELASGKITALEALIRWRRNGNFISPGQFIPFAQKTGQIFALGEWVFRQCCQQQKRWKENNVSVSTELNLSARQFERKNLLDMIEFNLSAYDLEPEDIRIEITESSLIENLHICSDLLVKIKDTGIKCVLDDFGTGYSSLSYLLNLPLSAIKLDRSFIIGIDENREKQQVVKKLIELMHCLNLKVTVEGVETVGELEYIHKSNCDFVQGFFLCRPVPPEDLEPLLEKGRVEAVDSVIR